MLPSSIIALVWPPSLPPTTQRQRSTKWFAKYGKAGHRQGQAEQSGNSRDKFHQTWSAPFSASLHNISRCKRSREYQGSLIIMWIHARRRSSRLPRQMTFWRTLMNTKWDIRICLSILVPTRDFLRSSLIWSSSLNPPMHPYLRHFIRHCEFWLNLLYSNWSLLVHSVGSEDKSLDGMYV